MSKKIDEITGKIIEEISPSKQDEDKVAQIVKEFTLNLNKNLKDAEAKVGGSIAKGTWLKDNKEIDIFAMFDYDKYKDKGLSDILEKSLKAAFGKYKRVHGSRDYFQIGIDGYTVEIIPILKLKKAEEAINITDVSMLHVGWVKKNIGNLASDIRLLKRFAQAHKIYGAESHINGFSGYVLEILTIYYKGFENALKEISTWKAKKIIDVNNVHKNVEFALNKSKLESPLILVDPVDKNRNASAALGEGSYKKLIRASKEFLKNPSRDHFERRRFDLSHLRKANKNLIVIEIDAFEGKSDVIGCKIIKMHDHILRRLSEFPIKKSGWEWDDPAKAYIWIVLESMDLPETKKITGPPAEMKEATQDFKKKYGKIKEEKGRATATVKRETTNAAEMMKIILKDEYLKDKAKRARII